MRHDVEPQRPARHRDDVENLTLRLVDPIDPRHERVLEPRRPRPLLPALQRVPHELVDEERMTVGLARDSLGHLVAPPRNAREELPREAPSVVRVQPIEAKRANVAERAEHLLRLGVSRRARRSQEQDRGSVGWPQDVAQEGEAVRVRPLHVVDREDDREPARHLAEQLAHRAEELSASLLRIDRHPVGGIARVRERTHPPQHRKRLREERRPPRNDLREIHRRHPGEHGGIL